MYGDLNNMLNKNTTWRTLFEGRYCGGFLKNQQDKCHKAVISYDWLADRCDPNHAEYTEDLKTLKKWTGALRYEVALALWYLKGTSFSLPPTRDCFYCSDEEYNNLVDIKVEDEQG